MEIEEKEFKTFLSHLPNVVSFNVILKFKKENGVIKWKWFKEDGTETNSNKEFESEKEAWAFVKDLSNEELFNL